MTTPNPWTKAAAFSLLLVLSAGLLVTASCAQRGAQQRPAAMASQAQQHWAKRLHGAWTRIQSKDDVYEATGAPTLRIDEKNFHEAWSDGRTRDSRWYVAQSDKDVVHIAVQVKGRAPEIWRLYLYTPQELVVFAPGLPPATYKRRGVETGELSPQSQVAQSQAVQSQAPQTLQDEMQREAAQALQSPDGAKDTHTAAPASAHTPEEQAAIDRAAEANAAAAAERAETSPEPAPSKAPRNKRAELEAIYQEIQRVQDAMTPEERVLGERLLIGTWDLTEAAIEEVNSRGEPGGVQFEGIVLKFSARERLSMIWKTVEETLSNGLYWRIEGMYGPELRVILTEPGLEDVASRERLQFLDVDHFILDPQGQNLRFERRQ